MTQPILITGAAGGDQGSTGRIIATTLLEQGISVRALVHRLDDRSKELRRLGAEILEGDLLNPVLVQRAMENVKRAYFTYPVVDGLLEAATIFAVSARDAGLELIVNNSQFQGVPDDPTFRELRYAPSFRNLQHRLVDRVFDWAQVGAVHIQASPYYENVRALVSRSVAEQNTAFLPWGDGSAIIPLTGAEDVARVAATLLVGPIPSETVYPVVSDTPTVNQIVEELGNALGHPVRYVSITDEQWAAAVKDRLNPHALDHLGRLWQHFRKGGQSYRNTDTVRRVTHRNAHTLKQFFRANAAAFRSDGVTPRPM